MTPKINSIMSAIALLALVASSGAQAGIVGQGSDTFTEPSGFYSGVKSFIIYTHDDPANPAPGAAGDLTYVYTITNNPGSFLGIIGFNIDAPVGSVVLAGSIDDGNLATPPPSGVIDLNNGVVRWDWSLPDIINPDLGIIDPGQTSDLLYIISAFTPGTSFDTIYSVEGDFAFDTQSTCVGPVNPPAVTGDALPCTIGFWKNRAAGKNGVLQFFPLGEFDAIVTQAVALSGGLYISEADLLANLGSKGKRSIQERGKQQLAATLLNLAAGELATDNMKCELFAGNFITSNACGDAISVGTAVTQAVAGIVGDTLAQHEAQECSDDINNGIGVLNSAP